MSRHSRYSPSSRSRWSACPGSVRLITSLDLPETTTEFASEGTAAHALAADCLENDRDVASNGQLQSYLDHARSIPGAMMVEKELQHPLYPDMHGTPDLLVYDFGGTITICDLKWGEGVVVPAGSPQLRYYAVMAARAYPDHETVATEVFQPRGDGSPLRVALMSPAEIEIEEHIILDEIEACEKPDAPLVPGQHCQFCDAKPHCPALHANTQLAAGFRTTMPEPAQLRPDQRDWLLRNEKQISAYLKAVYLDSLRMAQAGELPGWKTVEGLGNRRWKDDTETLKAVKKLGKKLDEVAPRALLSPAQMEARAGVGREWIDLMTERPTTAPRLVPDTDPRPAVNAIDVFKEE